MLMKEFEGKTEKDAIKIACDELKLSEDQIKIELIDQGKVGFFGFRNKSVKIKVFYEESAGSPYALECKKYIEGLLNTINIPFKVAIVNEEEDKVFISISSSESGLLIGKKGKNLEAIQFIINMALNKNKKDKKDWKKIILDIEGYWNRREEAIKKVAMKAADFVRTTKRTRLLQTMNPFEKRLVHMTLQNFNDIGTRSEGDGTYKKVRIFLK